MYSLLNQIDINVTRAMSRTSHPWIEKLMIFVTKLGDYGAVWIGIGVVFMILPEYRTIGIHLMVALLLALILSEGIIKPLIRRPRPFVAHDDIDPGTKPPTSTSFPSSHSAISWTATVILSVFFRNSYPGFVVFIILLALLISISRIYLRVHYLSDVIAGWLLGCGIGYMVILVLPIFLSR